MLKFFSAVFFIFVAAVIVIFIAKDAILQAVLARGVTQITGFPTQVESVKYDLPSTILIQGLQIQNPDGFQSKTFVNIPEIFVIFDLKGFLKSQGIHLPEVRLNIQEVNIEKKPDGISNIELLSSLGGGKKAAPAPPPSKKEPIPFWLEKLQLTIRQVSLKDRSGMAANLPVGNKLAVDLRVQNEVFTDIRDPKVLVNLIVAKILSNATLGQLLDLDPVQLLGDTFSSTEQILSHQVDRVSQQMDTAAGKAKDLIRESQVTQKTGVIVGGATTTAKNQLSGLLGKMKKAVVTAVPTPTPSPT